jgi:hypothetical protein
MLTRSNDSLDIVLKNIREISRIKDKKGN